jgi:predicted transcriptional regulator
VATKTKRRPSVDAEMIKALGHPYRVEALQILNERGIMSPVEIAREMGVDVNLLAHHVRVLRKHNCIELVDTKPRRGATEHFYRATRPAHISEAIAAALPQSIREGISGEVVEAIVARIVTSIEAGRFDAREERFAAWMPLRLDEQGWREFVDFKVEMLARETEIKDRATERILESGDQPVEATTVSMCFEMPVD